MSWSVLDNRIYARIVPLYLYISVGHMHWILSSRIGSKVCFRAQAMVTTAKLSDMQITHRALGYLNVISVMSTVPNFSNSHTLYLHNTANLRDEVI